MIARRPRKAPPGVMLAAWAAPDLPVARSRRRGSRIGRLIGRALALLFPVA